MKLKNNIFATLLLIAVTAGCSSTPLKVASVRIKGSDTMLHLTSLLAQQYMEEHPGISIYVEGGGTASGVRALIRGEIDICTGSRNLEADEVKLLAEQYGSLGVSFLIAKDGLSIYLNEENPVKEITTQQLKDIYTCKIKNWKELGGADRSIMLITRNTNSGTYLYFKEHILEGNGYCTDASAYPTTQNVIDQVNANVNAIGYGGVGFKADVYFAKINGIEPTEENIRNDKYPISRYLHFYTLSQPDGAVKDFIDWVLSPGGQKIIEDAGFISLFEISF